MRRYLAILLVVAALVAAIAGMAPAQDMTEEQQAAMMKAMTPGEHHKHLAQFAGKFEYTSKMWMHPGVPAMESSGSSEAKMILGGRYLEDVVKGTYTGMPYEGRGLTGFDNMTGEYKLVWVDNFSTGMLRATGKCSEDGKTITLEGTSMSPTMAGEMPFKEVIRIVDDKHHIMEWYAPGPGGEMFKMMEMSYTRVD
jgi:hypothetical protein